MFLFDKFTFPQFVNAENTDTQTITDSSWGPSTINQSTRTLISQGLNLNPGFEISIANHQVTIFAGNQSNSGIYFILYTSIFFFFTFEYHHQSYKKLLLYQESF